MLTDEKPLASPEQVAHYLGTDVQRLAKLRSAGSGPKFIKEGKRVLYRWSDIEEFLQRNTFEQTTGAGR